MVQTYYRIVDLNSCGQTLANRISSHEQAKQLLTLIELDLPEADLVIEKYTPRKQ